MSVSTLAPLTGLLAIVFRVIGFILFQTWADEPSAEAPAAFSL